MNMLNRHVLGLALAILLAGAALLAARPAENDLYGKVMGTADAKVIVQTLDGGEMMTLGVAPDARITRDGAGARLADLAIGDFVHVTMERRTLGLLATVIEARTPY
ncbi:MAG: hypothetical protein HYS13_15530 [Planctomycetia bacterium]|nr:hypothetical protein [Planctomycetia bacterium]